MYPWHKYALCRELIESGRANPKWWFPEKGHGHLKAVNICNRCIVRKTCYTTQLNYEIKMKYDPHGIFGAATAPERKRAIKDARRVRKKAKENSKV